MPTEVRVAELTRFPVKSCAGERLTATELGEAGLPGDRVLAVVMGDRVVTQREFAVLARVVPRLDDATGRLFLSLGGLEAGARRVDPVEGVVDATGPTRTVTIFGEPVEVVDQAPDLSDWFTSVLGATASLVAAPATTRRRSPGDVEGRTVLSDEGSVSVHSRSSLDLLNATLAERGHAPLPADRFRANIVLDGGAAHAEDHFVRFATTEVELGFAQLDERCVVTTVDQSAGRRDGPEPIRSLAGYRLGNGGGVRFGIYAAVLRPGVIRVGDVVRVEGS